MSVNENKGDDTINVKKYYCSLCDYTAVNNCNLHIHFKGKKHIIKAKESNEITKKLNHHISLINKEINEEIKKHENLINNLYIDELRKELTDSMDAQIDFITKTPEDTNYICSGCGKIFVNKNSYKIHTYVCQQVSLKYKYSSELNIELICQLKQLLHIYKKCEDNKTNEINKNIKKGDDSDKLMKELKKHNNRLKSKYNSLKKQQKETENKSNMFEIRNNIIENQLAAFETKYNTLENQYATLDSKYSILENQRDMFEARCNTLENLRNTFEIKCNTLENQRNILETKCNMLENQRQILEDNIAQSEVNYNYLKNKYKKIKTEYQLNLRNELEKYKTNGPNINGNFNNNNNINNSNITIILNNNPPFEYQNPFIDKDTKMPRNYNFPEERRVLLDNADQDIEIKAKLCNGIAFHTSYINKEFYDLVATCLTVTYQKDDPKERSIVNTDISRNSFHVRLTNQNGKINYWHPDKMGEKLALMLFKPTREYIIEAVNTYAYYCAQKFLSNKEEFTYPYSKEDYKIHRDFLEGNSDLFSDDAASWKKYKELFAVLENIQGCVGDIDFNQEILTKISPKFYLSKNLYPLVSGKT